jgi:hypothetical protein
MKLLYDDKQIIDYVINKFNELSSIKNNIEDLEIYFSNSLVVMNSHYVFRLGCSISLNIEQELKAWEIGRNCGGVTPKIIEIGNLKGSTYMIYERINGTKVQYKFPEKAGQFLKTLHSQNIDNLPLRGNWPSRRNKRFEVALKFANEKIINNNIVIELITKALVDIEQPNKIPVHGDFRSDNLLILENDSLAILDWSEFHLGSREEDIGGCEPKFINELTISYMENNNIQLDKSLIAGHSLARVLSLIKFEVLHESDFYDCVDNLSLLDCGLTKTQVIKELL